MSDLTKTIKLRIHVTPEQEVLFRQMTEQYRQACNFVSRYIFDNQFDLAYSTRSAKEPDVPSKVNIWLDTLMVPINSVLPN